MTADADARDGEAPQSVRKRIVAICASTESNEDKADRILALNWLAAGIDLGRPQEAGETGARGGEAAESHWWCPHCRTEALPQDVTFHERHAACGYQVGERPPEKPDQAGGSLPAHIADLWRQVFALIVCRNGSARDKALVQNFWLAMNKLTGLSKPDVQPEPVEDQAGMALRGKIAETIALLTSASVGECWTCTDAILALLPGDGGGEPDPWNAKALEKIVVQCRESVPDAIVKKCATLTNAVSSPEYVPEFIAEAFEKAEADRDDWRARAEASQEALTAAEIALRDLGACDDPKCEEQACVHALVKVRRALEAANPEQPRRGGEALDQCQRCKCTINDTNRAPAMCWCAACFSAHWAEKNADYERRKAEREKPEAGEGGK